MKHNTSSRNQSIGTAASWCILMALLFLGFLLFYLEETGAQATGLSAVAMQENDSDVIEVRYSEDLSLEVLLNQRVLNFSEQTWMDLKG